MGEGKVGWREWLRGQQGGAQDDISLFGFMFTTVIAWVDWTDVHSSYWDCWFLSRRYFRSEVIHFPIPQHVYSCHLLISTRIYHDNKQCLPTHPPPPPTTKTLKHMKIRLHMPSIMVECESLKVWDSIKGLFLYLLKRGGGGGGGGYTQGSEVLLYRDFI